MPNSVDSTIITQQLDLGAHGLTVVVKECLGVSGLPTRCGSKAFAMAPAEMEHADVVARLIEAGCKIIGRTTMHELAFGVTGINHYAGTPINPKWPDRIPGGSSSGSAAAVASGLVDFAIGTDTGGSIRQPACCCGVYGLKPSFGAVSRKGAIPRSSSLDCIGPFAASAEMLTKAMEIILPGFQAVTIDAPRLGRIAVECDDDITAALDGALAGLDATTVTLASFDASYQAGITVINYELAACWGDLARSDATLGSDVRARILRALQVTDGQRSEAEDVRERFSAEIDAALTDLDALVLPTMPSVPPLLKDADDPNVILPTTAFVRPFNLSGHPALTIPLLTAAGLPAGLQLVGRKGEDAKLCAIAENIAGRLAGKGN